MLAMDDSNNLDIRMRLFRSLSREVFNIAFYVDNPWSNTKLAWNINEYFTELERHMFNYIVLEPLDFQIIPYGRVNHEIEVIGASYLDSIPALLNRDIESGYWDYPIKEIPSDAKCKFISFFDWSDIDLKDYEFVKITIITCKSLPEIVGKHALVAPRNIIFVRGRDG
ncbi:hypothetical protein [Methylocystis parvus]|uniref:Uncharacterized protein n=1 Tax=Methylocystis parvus TaxID=134 RepID=A0A6B8M9W3_9HYPH|nr:hypothetical protein [Methylocystis parvus]QGM98389.1 hypothetical protein F7D14_13475 [Methylocystis parvus]WBK01280.1 hypothetical protein MMG94_06090 [Methylocystis parvus OBBP]